MEVHKNYVIYQMSNIMGNEQYQALTRVEFKSWDRNEFETEDEAIEALVKHEMHYEDYFILRHIYIN